MKRPSDAELKRWYDIADNNAYRGLTIPSEVSSLASIAYSNLIIIELLQKLTEEKCQK